MVKQFSATEYDLQEKNRPFWFLWLVCERPTVDVSDPPQYDGGLVGLLICGFGQIGTNMKITILMPHT